MKSIALTATLSIAMTGSSLAVPMMAANQMSQGHAVAHINAESLKNNLEMAKANTMEAAENMTNMDMRQRSKRQTPPNTAGTLALPPSSGAVPSVTLTDLDRVVSSIGVIVKGAQDDLKKIDIKDPQGISGLLVQLLGNTTKAIQQGTTRVKANNKAMIYPGWGVAGGGLGGLGGLDALGGLTGGGLSGLPALRGLTGFTGLLTSFLSTVTGPLGGGAGSGSGTVGGIKLGSLTDLANLSNLLGGLTGGGLTALSLGDLSGLTGILTPELLEQLFGSVSSGQPLSLVRDLVSAVLDLVSAVLDLVTSLLGGLTGGAISGGIGGGVTVTTP
ncbi:hypothetical protein B0T09DRAFT_376081 [Sordaria sp. MPI-SDFR-AT-0083]|nr:hypothetical protein B0T09DRAFT_376081 [Sordaria sp. MPI-SDFR-AT-0083]